MIIIMKPTATQADVQTICDWITSLRYQPRVTTGADQTVIACIGNEINPQTVAQLEALETVQEIIHVSKKYKLVSRDFKTEDSIVEVKGVKIGGGNIPVMAGPCAVESYDQFHAVVSDLTKLGIKIIRAMVYKPRTSTYDFQGLKEEGIRVLREVKKDFPDVAFITEVPGPNQIEGLMDVSDIFQVGARNSQNYDLLERYPIGEWNGAKIRRISGNLCHLCRGQVIALEDKRLFVMGGGESDEKEFRAVQAKWFPQEMPTPEEIESARQSLKQAGGKVDFVLSHICSDRLKVFLGLAGESHPLGQFFTELEKSLSFQKWFFASLHLDKPIPPKHQCVYQQILPLL